MQARVGKLRGGFCVYWREDGQRRRYRLNARTRAEAEAEAIDVIRRETKQPDGQTVSDIWTAYIEAKQGRPVAKTLQYLHEIPAHFGALRPDQITDEHCRAYTAKRRRQGRNDGTIWTELGHLRTALNWAVQKKRIKEAAHIERPQKPNPKDRWLTHDEIDRLLKAADVAHIKLAILLMLGTGGRVGAILDLTWDRVIFDRGEIDLRIDPDRPRKGRARVPMNSGLRAALTVAHAASLSDYVVEWAGDRVGSIRKGFSTACEAAGLDDVTPHVLRHTAGVHMAAAGVPLPKIGQFLGHTNIATTYKVYARHAPEHMQDAADVLDFARFAGPKTAS